MLDEKELLFAEHLSTLLEDDTFDSGSLILRVIPVFWESVGDRQLTIHPDAVYRPLYYVHMYGSLRNFEETTRTFLNNVSGHLEGCLLQLTSSPPQFRKASKPFGGLVRMLKDTDILSDSLADNLKKFNEAVNIPSKHFGAYHPTPWLDERTFSVAEAAFAFVMMRNLSIQLFALMAARGMQLPNEWPEFKDKWLTWSPLVEESESRPKTIIENTQ